MMPRKSDAEKYREHNREMKLAAQLGCTPIEARHELRRRAARKRIADRQRALEATRLRLHLRNRRDLLDPSGKPWMLQD